MNVTIKDIAKIAGVSIATVSMVVNNKDKRISEKTRQKVKSAIKEMNYVPNKIASSMVTKNTKTIGLILPDITNPLFAEFARGAEDKAILEGYTAILCNSDDDNQKELLYLDVLQAKMVDGIVFASTAKSYFNSQRYKNIRVPLVSIDRQFNDIANYARIAADNENGAFLAVDFMLKNGLNKIAHITGALESKAALERYKGYKRALNMAGIEVNPDLVLEGGFNSKWGELAVEQLLAQKIEFDSIFCTNDMVAAGVYKKLHKKGFKIPEDFSVVGFDDVEIAEILTPELTTVKHPKYEFGYKAMELLLKLINKQEINQDDYIFDTELIIRDSVFCKKG